MYRSCIDQKHKLVGYPSRGAEEDGAFPSLETMRLWEKIHFSLRLGDLSWKSPQQIGDDNSIRVCVQCDLPEAPGRTQAVRLNSEKIRGCQWEKLRFEV